MSFFSELLKSVGPALARTLRKSPDRSAPPRADQPNTRTVPAGPASASPGRSRGNASAADRGEVEAPGRAGPDATVEVEPRSVGPVHLTYSPVTDGDPDPGEIVWTWVPFEENDGRGKDRPVLVVAAEPAGTVLAVQLTSKDHGGQAGFVPVGSGSWDGEHRPSWANLARVLRVHPGGMRREAAALDRAPFEQVAAQLRRRYSWN